jgi:hypothetical protein
MGRTLLSVLVVIALHHYFGTLMLFWVVGVHSIIFVIISKISYVSQWVNPKPWFQLALQILIFV